MLITLVCETLDLRTLTPKQLRHLGMAALAYVKPVKVYGSVAFSIHAADGTRLAVAADRVTALNAIRQHCMTPALVH